jgi:hypothetical protein
MCSALAMLLPEICSEQKEQIEERERTGTAGKQAVRSGN